jgi:hypothetical protein
VLPTVRMLERSDSAFLHLTSKVLHLVVTTAEKKY